MALFESYERRIDQINAELAKHGIASIEEAKKICDDAGVDGTPAGKSTLAVDAQARQSADPGESAAVVSEPNSAQLRSLR